MAADSIELIIVTPGAAIAARIRDEVTLPGADGQLGVLPGPRSVDHRTWYRRADVIATKNGGQSAPIAIISGFAEVLGERVTVLAETAERPEEIDVARAERAKKRAEERLAAAANDPDIDWDRAAIALQRSLIRIQVARRQHSVAVPGE